MGSTSAPAVLTLLLLAAPCEALQLAGAAAPAPAAEALLARRPVVLTEANQTALEAHRPGFRATLRGVELSAITYRSDGFEVRG